MTTLTRLLKLILIGLLSVSGQLFGQSIRIPWSGFGHEAQHDSLSAVKSQPLTHVHWSTPVDIYPQYSAQVDSTSQYAADAGNEPTADEAPNPAVTGNLFIHYGCPLITRSNTVLVPLKTGQYSGFAVESVNGATGTSNWVLASDYALPPHDWVPSYSPALTPKNRLVFPGGGGKVFYCDSPDSSTAPAVGQLIFYGAGNYNANSNTYLTSVYIDTPITSDRYGNIFFGFQVTGSATGLRGGLARIDADGNGTWISASNAVHDPFVTKVAQNSAPALSNDHKTLYVVFNVNNSSYGYLAALDSRTLAVKNYVRLKDAHYPTNDAYVGDNGSASPAVGPDGDVYFGVQENPTDSNLNRGWLLHYDGTLTHEKTPGPFGWDDTASIVPASLVPSYNGGSSYLVMTKYNNYVYSGGNGVNKLGIFDPNSTMTDPVSGTTVMNEVLSIAGVTPDPNYTNSYPNAVREWCVNSAAVDPFTKSILANNEDGKLYRWDLTSNTFSEATFLTPGFSSGFEAYTPTAIGTDGTVYAIYNATLFAVGH